MLGLDFGLRLRNAGKLFVPPNLTGALFDGRVVSDGELLDSTGDTTRPSAPPRVWDGDGSAKLRFADFPSETVTYYDNILGSEQTGSTDVNGDFTLPTNQVTYIKISTYIWNPSEITDSSSNNQGEFYDESGTYKAQVFNSYHTDQTDSWAEEDARGLAVCDEYGYTLADGTTHYKDSALTILYEADQYIQALRNADGSYSTQYAKGYVSDGEGGSEHCELEYVGRSKHNARVVDGVVDNKLESCVNCSDIDNVITITKQGLSSYARHKSGVIKASTEYLIVYEVKSQNLTGDFDVNSDGGEAFPFTVIPKTVGTHRVLITSNASISVNSLRFAPRSNNVDGEEIEYTLIFCGESSRFTSPLTDPLPTSGEAVIGNSLVMTDSEDKIYPLVYQSDTDNDTWYDDTDPQIPTAEVVTVEYLQTNKNMADQTFSKFDGDTLKELAHYEEPQTGDTLTKIKSYFGIA